MNSDHQGCSSSSVAVIQPVSWSSDQPDSVMIGQVSRNKVASIKGEEKGRTPKARR